MKHSKMDDLHYTDLELKRYFEIPGIQTKQVLNLFNWRVRMAPLGENFRGNESNVVCPLCQTHLDNQSSVFQCGRLKKEIEINCELADIYRENIKLETAVTITEIEEIREKLKK